MAGGGLPRRRVRRLRPPRPVDRLRSRPRRPTSPSRSIRGANTLGAGAPRAAAARPRRALRAAADRAHAPSVSLVGRGIRAILHELGPVLEVVRGAEDPPGDASRPATSTSPSSSTRIRAERLVRQLHALLFGPAARRARSSGRPGRAVREPPSDAAPETGAASGGGTRRDELLALARSGGPALRLRRARRCDARRRRAPRPSRAVDRVFYALKANSSPGRPARASHAAGLGFECVSAPELEHVLAPVPGPRRASASSSRPTSRRARSTPRLRDRAPG